MATIAVDKTDWLMRLIAPTSNEVKLSLINRLSESLVKRPSKRKVDMSFFDGLTGAWIDGTPAEEEVERIRDARTTGCTRQLADFR